MPEGATFPEWSVSIVSHGHIDGVARLLTDFRQYLALDRFELLLTLNIDEPTQRIERLWPGRLTIIRNLERKGFAANHNQALRRASGRYFAAVDPELRLHGNPFDRLQDVLRERDAGIATTLVFDEEGIIADNARALLSPRALMRRYLLRDRNTFSANLRQTIEVDWIAGLFMTMRAETFNALDGFDERYFLYCEDADLCLRAWNLGLRVCVVPAPVVTHIAQRQSLKRLRHLSWHCNSLIKLWGSPAYRGFLGASRRRGQPPAD